MDKNNTSAPVIPAGTNSMQNAVYNPLVASQAVQGQGQAGSFPVDVQAGGQIPQSAQPFAPQGQAMQELMEKKGFKNVDDFAKSYMELESSKTRAEMSAAELARIYEDARQKAEESEPIVPSQSTSQEDAVKIVEKIIDRKTRPLRDQLEVQTLFLQHPDASQYGEAIAKVVKENPGITWEAAYKVAKFDTLGVKAKEEGKQEAYQTIAEKQVFAAGSAHPASNASRGDVRPLEELIRDKSIPFTELQRMMRERFSQ